MSLSKKCLINNKLWSKYDFKDCAWYHNSSLQQTYLHLAQNCIALESGTFMVRNHNNTWTHNRNATLAKSQLINLWSQYGNSMIHKNTINEFFKDGLMPFSGSILIPNGPEFVLYKGQRRFNTWTDNRINGKKENLEDAETLLTLIRQALCNDTRDLSIEEVLQELWSDKKTEFRWLIHWLASLYQTPGFRVQTNTWLVGKSQGIGKGTLVRVMKELIGPEFVEQAQEHEFEKGWTDHVANKLLIEADEFKDNDRRHFVRMIKKYTTNLTPDYNKRHSGPFQSINCAYWIFTTNEMKPIEVEANNRRDMFIRTSDNQEKWLIYAQNINRQLNNNAFDAELNGFAYLLSEIDVDYDFINESWDNEFKKRLKQNTKSTQQKLYDEIEQQPYEMWADKIVAWHLDHVGYTDIVGVLKQSEFNDAIRNYCGFANTVSIRQWISSQAEVDIDTLFKAVRVGGAVYGKSIKYDKTLFEPETKEKKENKNKFDLLMELKR